LILLVVLDEWLTPISTPAPAASVVDVATALIVLDVFETERISARSPMDHPCLAH